MKIAFTYAPRTKIKQIRKCASLLLASGEPSLSLIFSLTYLYVYILLDMLLQLQKKDVFEFFRSFFSQLSVLYTASLNT